MLPQFPHHINSQAELSFCIHIERNQTNPDKGKQRRHPPPSSPFLPAVQAGVNPWPAGVWGGSKLTGNLKSLLQSTGKKKGGCQCSQAPEPRTTSSGPCRTSCHRVQLKGLGTVEATFKDAKHRENCGRTFRHVQPEINTVSLQMIHFLRNTLSLTQVFYDSYYCIVSPTMNYCYHYPETMF